MSDTAGDLTPRQVAVRQALLDGWHDRPTFAPDVGPTLRARLEGELAPLAARLDAPLFVNKSTLSQVLGCEGHWEAEVTAGFEWSVPVAVGQIAHAAIAQSFHRRDGASPDDLVDSVLDRLADDEQSSVGSWIAVLDEGERADLRGLAIDRVAGFAELWPPMRPGRTLRTETAVRVELAGELIQLSGRPDLTIGSPSGTTAGKVVIDVKTGRSRGAHLDDLRFYALLETIKLGVPPFRLVTQYLESGRVDVRTVTLDDLEAAVRRATEGVTRMLELRLGLRSAALRPGRHCRWCPARITCPSAATGDGADDAWEG